MLEVHPFRPYPQPMLCYDLSTMSADSGSSASFRENSRAPVTAPVTIQIDAFSEPLSGQTANVSLGGMFIQMDEPPPVGSIVRFQVEMGFPAGTVKGTAEVVWMRAESQGSEKPPGIGLQFRFVEEEGESLLRAVVERALEELGPEPEPEAVIKRRSPRPRPPRPDAGGPNPSRQRPGERKKAKKKTGRKPSKHTSQTPSDDDKQILGMPAEKAKLLILLILMAFLLLYLVL